jgi:hypothetical protein
MKKICLLIAGLCVLGLAVPSAHAAKKNKKGTDVFAKYDANSDGKLDDAEKEAIKKAFATDSDLKQYDANSDGKLDDSELDSVKPVAKKKKKKDK